MTVHTAPARLTCRASASWGSAGMITDCDSDGTSVQATSAATRRACDSRGCASERAGDAEAIADGIDRPARRLTVADAVDVEIATRIKLSQQRVVGSAEP